MKHLIAILTAIGLAACAATHEEGPDTPRKVDADGNPNFGPR